MIKSMTGYGRGENQDKYHWVVEVRSINHRFFDIFIRLPKPWLFLEDKIKKLIRKKITRGKIDVYVKIHDENLPVDIKIDKTLVSHYHKKLVELKRNIGFEGPISLSLLSLLPDDVFTFEKDCTTEEELWESLAPALDKAIEDLVKMRIKEGENLFKDLNTRLEIIKNKAKLINERAGVVPIKYKKRLINNLQKLRDDISFDQEKIEAEVVLFAERANITEEIVRLQSHLIQMMRLMHSKGSVGKKLDFIAQEMLRETNTIAAKASDYYISKEVIEIKSELEKVREQIQNIE